MERTPPLTPEGAREVLHELEHGSPDTPERRRMFELAESTRPFVEKELAGLLHDLKRPPA